jgi:hypothetical protein
MAAVIVAWHDPPRHERLNIRIQNAALLDWQAIIDCPIARIDGIGFWVTALYFVTCRNHAISTQIERSAAQISLSNLFVC